MKTIRLALGLGLGLWLGLASGSGSAQAQTWDARARIEAQANEQQRARWQAQPTRKRVTLSVQNVSLAEALRELSRLAEVDLLYNPALIPDAPRTLHLQQVTLDEALKMLLEDTGLEAYLSAEGDITIKRARTATPGAAAQLEIRGQVRDSETGEPLPGVSILLKGTSRGTVSDIDGNFRLSLPSESGTLVFVSVGYERTEIAVAEQADWNIALRPDIRQLSEVVVVGYGTQERRDLTGAVSSISAKEFQATANTTIEQGLQGRIAGVQVTQTSGQPGGSVNIRVRGWSSISAGNEPLYVIDGVPFYNWGTTLNNGPAGIYGTGVVHNALAAINPNDIVSIEVLKDAAAAAIYGSRAANGVVIITTKRGQAGQALVEFDSYYGVQQVAQQISVLNARDFAELINESRNNAWEDLGSPEPRPNNIRQIESLANPASLGEGTNWQDFIFKDAPMQNHQLTISGGNAKTKYAVSGGYFNQDGIILNSGYKRYSARLNLDQEVNKRLKIGSSITINNGTNEINRARGGANQGGVLQSALLFTPTVPVYTEEGEFARPNFDEGFPLIDNPVALAEQYWHVINTTRMIANVFGELALAEGLTFRTSVGLDANYLKNNIFVPTTAILPPSNGAGAGFAFASQELIWLNENILSYSRRFGSEHDLAAVAGFTIQGSEFERMISRVFNFPNDLVQTTNGGQTDLTNSFFEQWRLVSFLGRVNYGFRDKYLLSVAMRADGSSRFGPDNRFGYFPSVSAGWRLSGEDFLKDVSMLDDLKLRASYGLTGNSEIQNTVNSFANYAHIGSVRTANYAFGGVAVNGLAPGSLSNRELGWEATGQWNLGLDLSLWGGRLNLSGDVYDKVTRDMLVSNTPLAFTTGFSGATLNVGRMRNRGWELALGTVNTAGAFTWRTDFNVARNRNEVLDLGTEDRRILTGNNLIEAGVPVSSFFGHQVEGIFQSEEEIRNAPTQPNARPGDIRFRDINGDGVINQEDRTVLGSPLPDYFGGITNTFIYKGFELTVFFQGVYGNKIVNQLRRDAERLQGSFNGTEATLNRWRSPEQPGDGQMPRAIATDPNNNNRFSDRWIEDGSFTRLKTLTIGYNFPASVLAPLRLTNLRLYATGQNLLTFTQYKGYDPEVGNSGNNPLQQGIDESNYPLARIYLLGINIKL